MSTYHVTITREDETIEHAIEAKSASVNYNNGVIEAVKGDGHFEIYKIPEDWKHIEARQELSEEEKQLIEEQKAAAEAVHAVPAPVPQGVPGPIMPPGQ